MPNCTIPTADVHFIETPTARGTFDILMLALPTLLLCTWTVQHPNVLTIERDGEDELEEISLSGNKSSEVLQILNLFWCCG